MTKKRIRLLIFGRVQRVFFRDSAGRKARSLGINGWIRNLDNGGVEALLEGEGDSVDKMVEWAKRGPVLAKVSKIDTFEEDYSGEFCDFKIKS